MYARGLGRSRNIRALGQACPQVAANETARALRVTITTGGSRGEVQPYVALGLGLETAGHEVRISAPAAYQHFVRDRGLGFHPISGDPHQLVSELLEAGHNPVRFARRFRRILGPLMEQNLQEYLAACRDAEVIVYSPVGFLGYYVAEALRVPRVGAALYPLFSRTRYFPSSIVPQANCAPGGPWAVSTITSPTSSPNSSSGSLSGRRRAKP